MNPNYEEGTVLLSQLNWLEMIRNPDENPGTVMREYILYSDAHITGDLRTLDGPYAFLNTIPIPSTAGTISAPIVLRAQIPVTRSIPDMSQTDESLYHGGELVDEIAALASLSLGIRLLNGGISREFGTIDNDPYGRPCEWGRVPKPILRFRSSVPVLPSVGGSRSLEDLKRLGTIPKIEPKRYVSLIRACRSYQEALWIAESEPNLAWLLLVSAIETAANDVNSAASSPVERLKTAKPDLAARLEEIGGREHLQFVADQIADTLRATKKFIDFLIRFLPDPPAERPQGCSLQLDWTEANLKKVLLQVYDYRSRALHAGIPFPEPMLRPPFGMRPGELGSEVPLVALGTYSTGGTWIPKDVPINLHSFHYITRHVLLKWWENELVQQVIG